MPAEQPESQTTSDPSLHVNTQALEHLSGIPLQKRSDEYQASRVWRSVDGRERTARLVAVNETSFVLATEDGRRITIPLNRLDDFRLEDQHFVRERLPDKLP
jgi:hypothetical protein